MNKETRNTHSWAAADFTTWTNEYLVCHDGAFTLL